METVVGRIQPIWVDRVAALRILQAANAPLDATQGEPAARPVLAINARMERAGKAYVDRALCCSLPPARIMPFHVTATVGEGQEKEVRARLEADLVKRLRLLPSEVRDLPRILPRVLKPGFFVILTRHPVADHDAPTGIDIVMDSDDEAARPISAAVIEVLRTGFRDVTFLALAGPDLVDVDPQAAVEVVEPRLREGVEEAAIAAAINLELLSRSD